MAVPATGLSRILSGEPLPLPPEIKDPVLKPAMEKYVRDLHDYLRRLFGKFTGVNIWQTIVQEYSTELNTYIDQRVTNIIGATFECTDIPTTFTITCNGDGTMTVTPGTIVSVAKCL
jgi:hypothetical protein